MSDMKKWNRLNIRIICDAMIIPHISSEMFTEDMSETTESYMNVRAYCRTSKDIDKAYNKIESFLLGMQRFTVDEVGLDFQCTTIDPASVAVAAQLRDKINSANAHHFTPVVNQNNIESGSARHPANAPHSTNASHPAHAPHATNALHSANSSHFTPANPFREKIIGTRKMQSISGHTNNPPIVNPQILAHVNYMVKYIDEHPINHPDFSLQTEKNMTKILNFIRSVLNISIDRETAREIANEVLRIQNSKLT